MCYFFFIRPKGLLTEKGEYWGTKPRPNSTSLQPKIATRLQTKLETKLMQISNPQGTQTIESN